MAHFRPTCPPVTLSSATQKVRKAEDACNSCDPEAVSLAYTNDSRWRNRSEFLQGREAIVAFPERKWQRELDCHLMKELWAFHDRRLAVRFVYESHDADGHRFRSFGSENWEFDDQGLMRSRPASINDLQMAASDRRLTWPRGIDSRRPAEFPGLTELGL